ncbi:YoaK family protein [Cellulomonas chengniuliangii]|uniref:DUF1275 domain-containing protein n=1 Tax=Cellulomonas chengniuliangii TaxID=2968084 RepID=A0ABY5KXL5_9CELL|nr:YoaK family protein [Cellulomonas chengniuliangii]MCC2310010.1 DUF1275 domain-containing protein [Cellulomonas chengniuliangii]UUI74593.1 DUF1275 domain-containing protein [Cellulomonas chengniuliangii]
MLDALPQDPARREPALMFVLTFSTGMIDAAAYLDLGSVFAGNMTGNVLILGMGLGRASGVPVAGPALALLLFTLGAALGGRLLRGSPQHWTPKTTVAVVVTGAAVGVAALLTALAPEHGGAVRAGTVALLSSAMGLQAAAARQVGVADITTVVVTSTITRLAADLGGGDASRWPRRVVAVAVICAGAVAGALLLRVGVALALGVAAALVLTVAVAGARARR